MTPVAAKPKEDHVMQGVKSFRIIMTGVAATLVVTTVTNLAAQYIAVVELKMIAKQNIMRLDALEKTQETFRADLEKFGTAMTVNMTRITGLYEAVQELKQDYKAHIQGEK